MAFELLFGTPRIRKILVTDSEAVAEGEVLTLSSGRLTKTAAGGVAGFVACHAVTAGTDQTCRVIPIDPTQVYKVAYTGTADGGFVEGVRSADIDSTALLLNAADVTGGPCTVLKLDTTNKTALVVFNNTFATVN